MKEVTDRLGKRMSARCRLGAALLVACGISCGSDAADAAPTCDAQEPPVSQLWQGGEGIRITDFSAASISPADGVTTSPRPPDKWELVSYETTIGSGTMLFARAGAQPKPVTIDPKLKGWHRIYVATFSGYNGRLWMQLSGDPSPSMFVQGKTGIHWLPCEQGEEVCWKCADLTGQTITVGKPEGKKAHEKIVGLMWLRFVPMSDAEVAIAKNEFSSRDTKRLHAHCDTDCLSLYGPDMTIDEFCSMIEEYRESDVEVASLEVSSTLSDKEHMRKLVETLPEDMFESRLPTQLALDANRDAFYRAITARADKYGIKLLAAHRMGLSNFVFPAEDLYSDAAIAAKHPEWTCRDRDGEAVGYLSYAYPEVGDYMIDQFLKQMRLGFHGATLILHRGIQVLFEEPILKAFRRKHPNVDPLTLSLNDPRLAEARSMFFTDFLRRMRCAFDRLSAEQGRPRLLINPIVLASREDNLRQGLDVETWMREKLVDSVVVGPMSLWEDEEKFRDDSNPKLLSVEKYTACKNKAECGPVLREFDNRHEWRLPSVPWFVNMSKETGVPVYFDIQWEGTIPPEEIPAYVQKYYDLGAERISLWDCFEYRVSHRPEWFVTSRIGHKRALKTLPTQTDAYRRRFRILMLKGGRFSGYHPSWRG